VPRRILLLITDLEIGGTPTVVRELAMRLGAPPDVHVEVAVLKDLGPVGAFLRTRDFVVTPLGARSALSLPWVIRRLRRLIIDHKIDTVVSFLVHANVIASIALPGRVRLFQSIQTTQARPKWHWKAQRFVSAKSERILVPTPSIAQIAHERSGIALERFAIIPNAIDPDAFARSPIPDQQPARYPIGFIGRLDPVKRIPDLIDAVMPLGQRIHLEIFGDGPEKQRISRLGVLSGCFTLHGVVPAPREALEQIGLLALPSEAEGFGLVLIEAMAAGVPVVATDAPGIRDVVQNEINGLLVPVGDVQALRAAILRVIEDRNLRDRLVAAGLKTVREKYTWEIVLPQYRRVLGIGAD
jgi:glycosyltransferase involved in cell wall biosynthesis